MLVRAAPRSLSSQSNGPLILHNVGDCARLSVLERDEAAIRFAIESAHRGAGLG
jgi:hypothetical protein